MNDERRPTLHAFEDPRAQRPEADAAVREAVFAVHRRGAGANGHYLDTSPNFGFRDFKPNTHSARAVIQLLLAGAVGLEPTPSSLTVRCPTNWTTPQPFLDCKREWNLSSHAFLNGLDIEED
jgi:hypothetical protein